MRWIVLGWLDGYDMQGHMQGRVTAGFGMGAWS